MDYFQFSYRSSQNIYFLYRIPITRSIFMKLKILLIRTENERIGINNSESDRSNEINTEFFNR